MSLLTDIDTAFGTHTQDLPKTINDLQSAADEIKPFADHITKYWSGYLVGLFVVLVIAVVVGNKITG